MKETNFLKVIAGIENRDPVKVTKVLKAAAFCKVEAVDICDSPEIIQLAKEILKETDTKIFVSSLDPQKLLSSSRIGADYLELGNYDHLYPSGIKINRKEILDAVQTLLDSGETNLSVTVPGYLTPNEQADLAQELCEMGVPIIQTEGGSISSASENGAIGQIEKAKVTLANTIELKKACPRACILAAGGLSAITVPMAIAAGANGVGIGKAISNLASEIEMIASIKSVQESLYNFQVKMSPVL
ncbi:MAG: DUF561 domain-containing protein [Candidatus Caenarcaniphilales bacterium]|nr:DUF561 domain-containing protein [Candidatus Caenarcaniphilales bacterium]